MALPAGTTVADIDMIEIPSIVPSTKTTRHTNGLVDVNGALQYQEETRYLSSDNYYPAWYTPPLRTTTTASGTESLFLTVNSQGPSWWTDSNTRNSEFGTYTYDAITETYALKVEHTVKSFQNFTTTEQRVLQFGVAYAYEYYYPSDTEIELFKDNGYAVSTEGNSISFTTYDHVITWIGGSYEIIEEFLEGTEVVATTTSSYAWSSVTNSYLLQSVVSKHKKKIISTDCAEKVTTTVYDNWSTSCALLPYSSSPTALTETKLSVSPNPVSDLLTMSYDMPGMTMVAVRSLDGRLILSRRHDFAESDMVINTSSLLPGMYVITVVTENGSRETSKFIKA